jgi:hypothetical protein
MNLSEIQTNRWSPFGAELIGAVAAVRYLPLLRTAELSSLWSPTGTDNSGQDVLVTGCVFLAELLL